MMRVLIKITSTVLLMFGTIAYAGENYAATDFTPSGWGAFLAEVFRSVDAVCFALLILLVILAGMGLDILKHLRIGRLIPEALLGEVQEAMSNGEYEKALEVCEKSDSLIGQIFFAALSKTEYSFERMESAMRGEVAIQGMIWRHWVRQFKLYAVGGTILGVMGALVNAMRFASDMSGRPNVALALASSAETRFLVYNILGSLFCGALLAFVAIVIFGVCSSKLEKVLLEAERLGEELLDPFRPLPLPQEA